MKKTPEKILIAFLVIFSLVYLSLFFYGQKIRPHRTPAGNDSLQILQFRMETNPFLQTKIRESLDDDGMISVREYEDLIAFDVEYKEQLRKHEEEVQRKELYRVLASPEK